MYINTKLAWKCGPRQYNARDQFIHPITCLVDSQTLKSMRNKLYY
jgi:hypothetical protein